MDPARKGVDEAVLKAKGAHVRVIMITGDYLKTAVAIAKNINILDRNDDESKAVDCGTLRPDGKTYLSDEAIDKLTRVTCVFARAQPEDKLQIVKSLQRQKKVSAMTGDGVNDAPALNAAEIGVAMGIQGTEVAKGASDMILTDDNFCSIVDAVEKGRVIYSGIQKFVAFIMSVHIAEVMQIFFCVLVEFPLMREPVQILFLILVTDLPPSVALGMEPGQPGILLEYPRPRSQNIVLMWMWISIVMNGAILSLVIILVFVWALNFYVGEVNALVISDSINAQQEYYAALGQTVPEAEDLNIRLLQARTTAFISLVWAENVRAYVSRSFDRPIWVEMFRNRKMQTAIGMAQVALYAAIFIPGLSDTILHLDGTQIGWEGWVAAFAGAMGCLVLCELFKIVTGWQKHKFDEVEREIARQEESRREQLINASLMQEKPGLREVAAEPVKAAPPPPEVVQKVEQQSASLKDSNALKEAADNAEFAKAKELANKSHCAGMCWPVSALF
jgi:magnesium-transporting ATPase (P-type)